MNSQGHNAGNGTMVQVIPTKNLIQTKEWPLCLCIHPSASRPPTSTDQSFASRNIASDMTFDQDWRMNCCQRRRKICPTEISKWLTIKSKSSMTVKCTT